MISTNAGKSGAAYAIRQRLVELYGKTVANQLDAQLEGKSGAGQARFLRNLLEGVEDPTLKWHLMDLERS